METSRDSRWTDGGIGELDPECKYEMDECLRLDKCVLVLAEGGGGPSLPVVCGLISVPVPTSTTELGPLVDAVECWEFMIEVEASCRGRGPDIGVPVIATLMNF